MSTSTIEPGTRLAGRYRLEERIRESSGSTLWRAIDEILARAVAVRTFTPGFPRIGETVTAARSASRLTDPRLTQVFDADDSGETAYVVSEWVTGETLEAMLANGPLNPGRAATLLYEAAQALTTAHASGLAHLRLTPRDLLWTTGNTVKVLGLGVDAALAGSAGAGGDAKSVQQAADTRGLGKMLYAALTGFWPEEGDEPSVRGSLAPAPYNNGVLCNPRQVAAGVPQQLDVVACRGLGLPVPGAEPITTPAALAEALGRSPRVPLPLFGGLPSSGPVQPAPPPPQPARRPAPPVPDARPYGGPTAQRYGTPAQSYAEKPSHAKHQAYGEPRTKTFGTLEGDGGRRALLAVAVVLVVIVLGVSVWALTRGGGSGGGGAGPTAGSTGSPAPSKTTGKLTPVSADGFETSGNDGSIGRNTRNALTGNGDPWHSSWYATAQFGNLKKGIGLIVDMGSSVEVSKVTVQVPADAAGTLELRVGDDKSLGALKVAGRTTDAQGTFDITPDSPAQGRYVLLWFTKLPHSGGQYIAQIGQVSVYGRQG